MQTPFDSLTASVFDYVQNQKEHFKYVFNYIDRVLVWIVGFSIAAISAIVAKLADLSENYDSSLLKIILVLLVISIISGILFRVASLFVLNHHQNIIYFLEGAFSKERSMPDKFIPVENPENIYEIQSRLKNDFGQDLSEVVKNYEQTEVEDEKEYYLNLMFTEYQNFSAWSEEQHEKAHDYIKEMFGKAYHLPKDKVTNIHEKEFKDGLYLKIWDRISIVFLILTMTSFVSVLILLVVNYKS